MESLIVLGNFMSFFFSSLPRVFSVLYPSICGHCVIIDYLGCRKRKNSKVFFFRVSENKLIRVLSNHIKATPNRIMLPLKGKRKEKALEGKVFRHTDFFSFVSRFGIHS
jgi:hypothetical protein